MTNRQLNREELLATLDWYAAVGVDIAVSETPVDRFAQSTAAASPARRVIPPAQQAQPPAAPPVIQPNGPADADPQEARTLAASAPTLEALRAALEEFDGCGLKLRATNLVFADGNPDAKVMLVGDAPGRDEDLEGTPFAGRSGLLLDRMLASINLDRNLVYITNTVPWRPPGNRAPSPSEVAVCLPFLHRQIELVAPSVLIALGGPAAATLFETDTGISRLRGQWRDLTIGGHTMRAMAMLHPDHLLRQPAAKRLAWQDLLSIRAALDS